MVDWRLVQRNTSHYAQYAPCGVTAYQQSACATVHRPTSSLISPLIGCFLRALDSLPLFLSFNLPLSFCNHILSVLKAFLFVVCLCVSERENKVVATGLRLKMSLGRLRLALRVAKDICAYVIRCKFAPGLAVSASLRLSHGVYLCNEFVAGGMVRMSGVLVIWIPGVGIVVIGSTSTN